MGGQKQAKRHRETGDTDVIGYADVGRSNTSNPAALTTKPMSVVPTTKNLRMSATAPRVSLARN